MASIDLLEELQLNDYYLQKLSFSEAIKLRAESQNSCQQQYGLEIVRKLLLLDSAAVISVTTELNKRLSNTGKNEADNKFQYVADVVRPPQKSNIRPSWRNGKAEPTECKLHPMDLLVVAMNCCDDFLRQLLVEKMVANKLSIPILLPGVRNGSHTLLLFALKSLVPEVREVPSSLTETLVDVRNPFVSFIRVGNLHRSKSKLVNELLNLSSFNTFFHRECPNGSAKRSVANGSIEAAWYQSETATEQEFNNCRFFTALNLRGNARDYPKQTQFLCQSSTLVVFMVDSFKSFKELYTCVLKDIKVSQKNIIVYYISPESPDKIDDKYFKFLEGLSDQDVICEVKYDWLHDTKKMSDDELTNGLRKTISDYISQEHIHSNPMPTYANISRSGKNLGFQLDEAKLEYELGKAHADEFVDLVSKLPPDCKPILLPLQGEPWEKIGMLDREQRGKTHDSDQDEYFIAEKETEKRKQREIQCRSLIQQNEITRKFSSQFYRLQDQNLLYYLNFCKMKLDARSRVITSNVVEKYKKEKQEIQPQLTNKGGPEVKLSKLELKIANSAIGLEHMLRECGQMYEAVISEEIGMKKELKETPFTPDVICNFPSIMARLLLMGQPLELMDGNTSNVPITWLKAVLSQIRIMTTNAKVFVLSIIGVQSSGKSTLLNALFGLQFPVSAGRCTRGIYCHLIPVDKESLIGQYDYVMVVDTEGLRDPQGTGDSTFKDNELATFAIGLADATIINMKGENWSDMKDILQIAAHGLIRVRKTKADLELMPRCMFVHQNVPAVDAEEKNWLGQEKQLMLLDEAIKASGREEGFTEITKFNQVIKFDTQLDSWYFPDLCNGRPPKARISQDYISKTSELKKSLIQLVRTNPSKLTISGFFLRMSDLWNAMLHNDFVLCFRNTQEIISGTILNDKVSHEVDVFKNLNRLEQTKYRESICSFRNIDEIQKEKDRILREVHDAVEMNFTNMKATLKGVIDASDICAPLKKKYEVSLSEIKKIELRRIKDETAKVISVHMKKLEIGNEAGVRDLKAIQDLLEKNIEEINKDKLNETTTKEFEDSWQHLIEAKKKLENNRMNSIDDKIKDKIHIFIKFLSENKNYLEELFKKTSVSDMLQVPESDMPQVTESDIVQRQKTCKPTRLVMDFVYSKSYVYKAQSGLQEARKRWELQFQNQRDLEFNASHLEQILFEAGKLLGFSRKGHEAENDEMCLVLPPGYKFTRCYTIRFIQFACRYIYNRSLENCKRFILMTDPLADIYEHRHKSVSKFRLLSAEANIDAVSKQIFDYAERSFVRDLGGLIKAQVCKENNIIPTFKSKRAFLRTILTALGQRTHNVAQVNEEKQRIFKEFMLYVELAESDDSAAFFLDVLLKLLKEMLTKECENASETDFQKMVENNVGRIIEKAKNALRQAETNCKGCAREYIRIFKEYMNMTNEIDLRINTLSEFTDAVLKKIDSLYDDFLSQANYLFERLVCEDNRAAIRSVFEKIMGCREKCPFCSAPCSQSLQPHPGDHRANHHYPMGVGGTVDRWGLFKNTEETHDAFEEQQRKPRKLTLSTCQTMVGTRVDIRTRVTVNKATKWFQSDCHSFKTYKEMDEYKDWDIPYSRDHNASLYWKWFMTQFVEELAEHYEALSPKIPEAWKKVTWEEAKESLNEPDVNFQLSVEEQCSC